MRRRHFRATAAAAVTLLLVACGPGDPIEDAARRMTATQFLTPYDMPAASLTDQHGEAFDLRLDTRNQLTLLFFGYTSCPDICPIIMSATARAVAQLDPALRERVGVVFITLDANRDDVETVRTWINGIDSTFVGLTGTQEELDAVLADFGYIMPPTEIPTEGFYEVAHPGTLFVFTPERLGRFGYPNGAALPDAIVTDLRILSEVWWPEEG